MDHHPFDLSRIQRVVLLVDLQPLLRLPDPDAYLSPLLSAARRILSSPPLAAADTTTLFAYKLFFSSLSPLFSNSNVHRLLGKSPTFLSFDRPAATLASLTTALCSLASAVPESSISVGGGSNGSSRASSLAGSLLQLEHDYGWESQSESQNNKGMLEEFIAIRPNLILLFSPLSQDPKFLSEFLELEVDDGEKHSLDKTYDKFLRKFLHIFGVVKGRMISRDIQLSWVNVCADSKHEQEENLASGFLAKGMKELGWGFCSTDVILLGSASVPFGLILPFLACSMGWKTDDSIKKGILELVLEIEDVNGKPLECKSCDLEFLDLNFLGERSNIRLPPWNTTLGIENVKIHIKRLWRKTEGKEYIKKTRGLALLSGMARDSRRDRAMISEGEFFADKILNLCCGEKGKFAEGKPVWQLLLSFLYKRNYLASASISDANGCSMEGIIMPFTVNYAILTIMESNSLGTCNLVSRNRKIASEMSELPYLMCRDKDGKKKTHSLHTSAIQRMTWRSFREVVLSRSNDDAMLFDLEELYFTRNLNKSKKLWFLKCWMRQITKHAGGCYITADEVEEHHVVTEGPKVTCVASQDKPDIDVICSSTGEAAPNQSTEDEAYPLCKLEKMENIIGSIPQKIEQGLRSEDADLRNLAERLVGLSIQVLYIKYGRNVNEAAANETVDDSDVKVATEMSHLLLRKPKDLIEKYKGTNDASAATNDPVIYSSEYKVREHELQILFRMEMLQSELGTSIKENVKQKMVKDVCSLLQFIDINLQGDLSHRHGVIDFAERTIKFRYSQSLPEIVQKIYTNMEFDLFDEYDLEASDSLPNSNSHEFKIENEDEKNWDEKKAKVQEAIDHMHEQTLIRAQGRRDRLRRIKSFTSWMPDLQRVWAPKHPKAEKVTCAHWTKQSKRKKRRLSVKDVVCETPMTERKGHSRLCSHLQEDDESRGHNSCKSLSKALFHQEDFSSGIIS